MKNHEEPVRAVWPKQRKEQRLWRVENLGLGRREERHAAVLVRVPEREAKMGELLAAVHESGQEVALKIVVGRKAQAPEVSERRRNEQHEIREQAHREQSDRERERAPF